MRRLRRLPEALEARRTSTRQSVLLKPCNCWMPNNVGQLEHQTLLNEFTSGTGFLVCKWLKEVLPNLPFSTDDINPTLSPKVWLSKSRQSLTSKSQLLLPMPATSMGQTWARPWKRELHEPLPPERCPDLPPCRAPSSKCRDAGTCVCALVA